MSTVANDKALASMCLREECKSPDYCLPEAVTGAKEDADQQIQVTCIMIRQ